MGAAVGAKLFTVTVEEFAKNLKLASGAGYRLTEAQHLLLTAPDRLKLAIVGGPRSASRSS